VNVPIAKSAMETGVFCCWGFSATGLWLLFVALAKISEMSLSGSSTIALIKLLACLMASGQPLFRRKKSCSISVERVDTRKKHVEAEEQKECQAGTKLCTNQILLKSPYFLNDNNLKKINKSYSKYFSKLVNFKKLYQIYSTQQTVQSLLLILKRARTFGLPFVLVL